MAIPPSYGGREIARTMPLPQAVNTDAPIAEGINAIGQAGQQYQALMREKQQLEQGAQFSVDLAKTQEDFEAWKAERQKGPSANYAKESADWLDQRQEAVFAGISDPHAKLAAIRQWSAVSGTEKAQAMAYESAGQVNLAKQNLLAAGDAKANVAGIKAQGGSDPTLIPRTLADIDQTVAMVPIGEDAKAAYARSLKAATLVSIARGTKERSPAEMRALLDTQEYVDLLDPKQREALVNEADVGIHQQAIAAERVQRQNEALAAKSADALYGDAERGVAVDPRALQLEADRVKETDPARAARFRAMASGAQATQLYQNADPAQTTAAIGAIEHQKGWQANPDLVAKHSALMTLRDKQRAAEPELGELDFTNPAAVRQRQIEADAWAATHNGQLHVLGKDQATRLGALATGGAAQRAQLADALSRLPGRYAVAAAQQVAHGDYALQQAVDLTPQLRLQLFQGEELRKADKTLVPTDKIMTRWGERGAQALARTPVQYQNSVLAGAMNVYAFRARQQHLTEFDQDTWDRSVNDMIAPTGGGGIGEWRSGLLGKSTPLVLPREMSQAEFNSRVWNMPESHTGAFYADKTPIPKSELLSRFRPEPIDRDGVYRFVDERGHYAFGRNGGVAELDVRRVPVPAPRTPGPAARPARSAYEALPTSQGDPAWRNAGGAYGAAADAGRRK